MPNTKQRRTTYRAEIAQGKRDGTLRYVCVFCKYVSPTFWDLDQHFSKFHKLGTVEDVLCD
jgi:hypothetical protein